jgi:hypothetical protein
MLLALLKSVSKWAFSIIENAGKAINDADERISFGEKIDESNEE